MSWKMLTLKKIYSLAFDTCLRASLHINAELDSHATTDENTHIFNKEQKFCKIGCIDLAACSLHQMKILLHTS